MERLCCILDADESYAVRVAACFNERRAFSYPVRAFSDLEAYRECEAGNEVELLLAAEDMYSRLGQTAAKVVIRLCEQAPAGGDGQQGSGLCGQEGQNKRAARIAKYQAVDNVIRDALRLYADEEPEGLLYPSAAAGKARLVCIYSPNGHTGKTTLGLALAHIKGQKRKVLYLNFEEFSAVGQELSEHTGNLSDALFYYHTSGGGIGKILSVVNRGNGFDYIAPAACAEDLPQFSADIIADFVGKVAEAGGYELIIVDIGALIKEPWKLLCRADTILAPKPDCAHRRRRQMEFEKYLHYAELDFVAERITLVDIVQDEGIAADGRMNYPKLVCSPYGRAVSAIDV